MAEPILCSAAAEEYTTVFEWYAQRSRSVAERFDAEFDLALSRLAAHPERFPRCDECHRFYLMRHFPYQIIYRLNADHLIIIAVAHTARQPRLLVWAIAIFTSPRVSIPFSPPLLRARQCAIFD